MSLHANIDAIEAASTEREYDAAFDELVQALADLSSEYTDEERDQMDFVSEANDLLRRKGLDGKLGEIRNSEIGWK
ncbi:hypothetical protein [Cereibacter johrii]|uniref:hypothetical protein n=1 Tax=Cereibacter johrii TaxID=445629 RepID=UPI000DCBA5FA|nr:hypothetical protein [Cereibacter johrii]RAZ83427.1 hypothetical protein DDV93_14045 [Cereibacter johrii]